MIKKKYLNKKLNKNPSALPKKILAKDEAA